MPPSLSSMVRVSPLRRLSTIRSIQPYIYSLEELRWHSRPSPPRASTSTLRPTDLLRVASWNINFVSPGPSERGHAAMDHLRDIFGPAPRPMAVMLQEVRSESLLSILEHPWVRLNFVLSDIEAWQSYFTIMMVSKFIDTSAWFRVPLESGVQRDALFVDIPLTSEEGQPTKNRLRLCTVHLESLPKGESLRLQQLTQISKFLNAPETDEAKVIAGMVGGDMNTILPNDQGMHKMSEVNLHDVWEDTPPLPIPPRNFRKDPTHGLARGNTWGYQGKSKNRKRLDKFLYTGLVETSVLDETQDQAGKLGRFGIGLKTNICAWTVESPNTLHITKAGKMGSKTEKIYLRKPPEGITSSEGRWVDTESWISDHFGIAVGIRASRGS